MRSMRFARSIAAARAAYTREICLCGVSDCGRVVTAAPTRSSTSFVTPVFLMRDSWLGPWKPAQYEESQSFASGL